MKPTYLARTASVSLASVLAVCGVMQPAFAADPQQTPYSMINEATAQSPVTPTEVRKNVTVLEGSGGNVTVLSGNDGLLMVDAGIALSKDKMEAVLRGIRPGKISYVIDTHWHWDHADGNGWAHTDGATIIAQRNTAKHLGETIRVVEWGHTFEPVPQGYRPTMIVDESKTMRFDGEVIEMKHYVTSHTDGDLSVYFRNADVLATGDTYWNGLYPFIDYEAGGGIKGVIAAAEANIAMTTDKTVVVPGHGPVATRQDLIEFRDMLVTIRDRVAALKGQGMTLDQAIAAKPTASFDEKWGKQVISPALFTELVYRGV